MVRSACATELAMCTAGEKTRHIVDATNVAVALECILESAVNFNTEYLQNYIPLT